MLLLLLQWAAANPDFIQVLDSFSDVAIG